MKKLFVLLGTLASCFVAGCGSDTNDQLVSETIKELNSTREKIDDISKIVKDAVIDSKNNSKPLAKNAIDSATGKAGELKDRAKNLVTLKGLTEKDRDTITKDQKEALAQKYKEPFQKALAALDLAQKNLDNTLKEADAVAATDLEAKGRMKLLRDKLKEGQDEFEVLAKRQS